MKQFFCGDVVPGCTAVFLSEEDETILHQVALHAGQDHGIAELTPDLTEQVLLRIRAASA